MFDPPLPTSVVKEPEPEATSNLKEVEMTKEGIIYNGGKPLYIKRYVGYDGKAVYDPPLPTSVLKEETYDPNAKATMINGTLGGAYDSRWQKGHQGNSYEPPLPTSVVKEENNTNKNSEIYGEIKGNGYSSQERKGSVFDPPLPTSVLKEGKMIKEGQIYNGGKAMSAVSYVDYRGGGHYEPPLPVSVVKEPEIQEGTIYGEIPTTDSYAESIGMEKADKHKGQYNPPLPVSVLKETEKIHSKNYETDNRKNPLKQMGSQTGNGGYDPPLPNSILEIKSTRGKHSTEKPVALMMWILKYFSKEGDIVLDPTMGSGSTGEACRNMNREFIGIEMDDEYFELCCGRLDE